MSASETVCHHRWYLQPIFSSFWLHYNECQQWLRKSGHKSVQFDDDLMKNECHNCSQHVIDNTFDNKSYSDCTDTTVNSLHQRLDSLETIDESEYELESEIRLDSDNNEQEVTDEYLEFVLQTKRHQLERKRLKEKRQLYNERVEYIDISRLESFSRRSIAPKKSNKNVKSGNKMDTNEGTDCRVKSDHDLKREKMHELYGEDYNMIQGMETAIQLNFDRLCDIHQPKLWPIMPIRMNKKT
ncbi:gem-associated protein 8-like [Oppia nitens]|uniref:gem-associated protein 8-like n=1 Tax=Oppia nitens TaxID=1686743 RepID=UPI0023DA97E9|nr:gem-associated protein 8-like [Oppia nitens]